MISGSGYLYLAGQQDTAGRDGTAKSRARERQGRHRLGGFIWRSGAILAPQRAVRAIERSYRLRFTGRARPASAGRPNLCAVLLDRRSSDGRRRLGLLEHRDEQPAGADRDDPVRLSARFGGARAGSAEGDRQPAGGTSSQPSRSARVASSVRDATSRRSNRRRRCDSTVFAPIPSLAAISSFERPSTTSVTTSSSRSLSLTVSPPARPPGERHPAGRGPPDRVDQLGDRRGLEHEPRRAEPERGVGVLRVVVRGQDDDRRAIARQGR